MRSCVTSALALFAIFYVLIVAFFVVFVPAHALTILYLAAWFLCGIVGIAAVALQPGHAFKAAGHSKGLQFLIQFIGFMTLTSLFTLAYFYFFVLQSVVNNGGYATGIYGPHGLASFPETGKSRFDDLNGPKKEVRCSAGCDNGKMRCYPCGGRGIVKDSATSTYSLCPVCHNNPSPCSTCHGRGTVAA
jgi:hypothetical protein